MGAVLCFPRSATRRLGGSRADLRNTSKSFRYCAGAVAIALAVTLAGCSSGRSTEAFCKVHDEYKERYLASMEVANGQLENEDTALAGILNGAVAMGDLTNMWTELAKVAPESIQADAEAVAEAWKAQSDAAGEMLDNPLGGLLSSLMTGFQAAGPMSRVDEFVRTNCDG